MAKKKRLVESLDEDELEYIKTKMNPEKEEANIIPSKLLNFKLKLKCKNQKQKECMDRFPRRAGLPRAGLWP